MVQDRRFPFEVDAESDVPLWVQLRRRIAYLIDSGYFQPGDKLPTVRGLASELAINYNTVNKAYLDLAANGYLESTRGRGAFVKSIVAEESQEHDGEIDAILNDAFAALKELGLTLDDVQRCVEVKVARAKREDRLTSAREGRDGAGRIVKVGIDALDDGAARGQAGA